MQRSSPGWRSRNEHRLFISSVSLTAHLVIPLAGLIAQLLALHEFDIDFVRFDLWNGPLQQNNLAALCEVLREIVTQLPDTILFCIIDGVSHFETERWRSQMREP